MSAAAESTDHVNGHGNGTAVLERIQQAWAEDDAEGRRRRGRPTLAAELGVSEHQVGKALQSLRQPPASQPPTARAVTPPPVVEPTASAAAAVEPDPTPAAAPAATPVAAAVEQFDSSRPTAPQQQVIQSGARLVAWSGFAFGSLMSIAANVLHAWLPADKMPPDWTPGLAPQIGAAVWPIGLLLSVEVLSRVAWRPGFMWGLARYGGAGTVAVGSGVISYNHLREVLVAWGYGHPGADVGPLVLDGLMVVCGFALLSMSPRAGGAR